jgi:hypothetical protein
MQSANDSPPQPDPLSPNKRHPSPRRSLRSRTPLVGPTLQALQRPENHVLEAMMGLAAIGYALVLVATVAPPTRGTAWLSVVGGAFLGVGTSVFCSMLAARQQTTEGYAKEANLRRKDNLYGPLYVEFRQVHDRLAAARGGAAAYPLWIAVPDQPHPLGPNFLPGFQVYSVDLWPAFKSDHRIDDFTHDARAAFDDVIAQIRDYNEAVRVLQEPVETLLADAILRAVSKVEHRPAYQHWRKSTVDEHGRLPVEQHVVSESADPQLQLFNSIAYGQSFSTPDQPLHRVWARSWLRSMPIHQPLTLGWLLANRPSDAAQFIAKTLRPSNPGAVAPLDWYERIFTSVQEELERTDAYEAFIQAGARCSASLERALHRLNDGLAYIRDRYEGGAPPV